MSETPLTDAFGKEPSPFQPGDAAQLIPLWIDFAKKLERDRARLKEALGGLIGLVELIVRRPDVPLEAAQVAGTNHRMVEARAALASLEEK